MNNINDEAYKAADEIAAKVIKYVGADPDDIEQAAKLIRPIIQELIDKSNRKLIKENESLKLRIEIAKEHL